MKKFLGILVLSLIFCNMGYAVNWERKAMIIQGHLKETKEEVDLLTKAIYASYLDSCSSSNAKYYSLVDKKVPGVADTRRVEIFESTKLDINCLEKKFEHHQKNYPVISFLWDNPMPPEKIIRNKETLKLNTSDMSFDKIEISSLFSQKCGENCTYSKETILINENRYWFIKGSNDRGIEATFNEKDKILIINLMTTHKRKYIFDTNEKTIIIQK